MVKGRNGIGMILLHCDADRISKLTISRYTNQYILRGDRFIHNNVIIRMMRTYLMAQTQSANGISGDSDPLNTSTPASENLRPLDPSGSHTIEASVRTDDAPTAALRTKAVDELLKFAEFVKGAIDFRVPGRLTMDTVVKG